MKNRWLTVVAALSAPVGVLAAIYGDTPDAKHAWAVHDNNRPNPVKVCAEAGKPPSDAIVLFDGSRESFEKNWCDSKGAPSKWACDGNGEFYCKPGYCNGGIVRTRGGFGDCQLHLEYRHDPKALFTGKGPQMRGNSGVFIMGNYEVQVLESYYTSADLEGKEGYVDNYTDGQAGSVYAENPPMVNPARKPGEWQSYDIIFHQPVWKDGKLLHPGSLTVFFNGVLVQDHWEMEGLTTHSRRRPLAPHPTKGKLSLQDHGCKVQFRNIWYRPLPSRWDNKTHSAMSADENEVMKLRAQTAAKLYAKIPDPKKVDAATLKALAEVISYENKGVYRADFLACLEAYRKNKGSAGEVKEINGQLDVLIRNKVISSDLKIK
jgi:hypothetical protein